MTMQALLGIAAADNFGACWGTPNGYDLSMPSYMASGNQAVAEAILRRWTTSRGDLVDDPNYGENIYDLINDDLSPSDIAYAQQRLGQEAQKDPRVLHCNTTLTLDVAGNLNIVAYVTTATGPFSLVISVNAVTLQLLLVQP